MENWDEWMSVYFIFQYLMSPQFSIVLDVVQTISNLFKFYMYGWSHALTRVTSGKVVWFEHRCLLLPIDWLLRSLNFNWTCRRKDDWWWRLTTCSLFTERKKHFNVSSSSFLIIMWLACLLPHSKMFVDLVNISSYKYDGWSSFLNLFSTRYYTSLRLIIINIDLILISITQTLRTTADESEIIDSHEFWVFVNYSNPLIVVDFSIAQLH